LVLVLPGLAVERKFEFSQMSENQTPAGFRSAVTGEGKPGVWKILLDEVPSAFPPLDPQATSVSHRAVLAQLSQDPTDEHFPLFIYEDESFSDFTLTTRFKTVRGTNEQMAGIAFRIQNETNYYVLRASSLGNTLRFYKVVNGERGNILGPSLPLPAGQWRDLTIECKGNQFRCLLDGKEIGPPFEDNSFPSGKVGFWTKSDSVSYFGDTTIRFTPREPPAQALVREAVKKYSRLAGLKIYVLGKAPQSTRLIASNDETELGRSGNTADLNAITEGEVYFGKDKGIVSVIMPLRDRNGDVIAAARVVMKSFAGQTEQNALAKAQPVVEQLQAHVKSLEDLVGLP
jgi:hypothetical protein